MAGHRDPDDTEPLGARSTTDSPFDASLSPAQPDSLSLVDFIASAQNDPPVGLILVGWDHPQIEPRLDSDGAPDHDFDFEHKVAQSVAFTVAACASQADAIVASATTEMALVRAPLTGPASAEALAQRLARQLDIELDRLAISENRPTIRWAIGVAVGHRNDRPGDLLRYAEAALNDAWLLGGRRVVAFDDGDRGLLDP